MSAVGEFTREQYVQQLVDAGVARTAAEREADRKYGSLDSIQAKQLEAEAIEDRHVAEGVRILRAFGAKVYDHHGVKRAAKVTPGEPDVLFFLPRRRRFAWWEAKAEWGRQSPAQKDFQEMCGIVGAPYILGGLPALIAWLVADGVCTRNPDGSLQPVFIPTQTETNG